ncbi:zinc ribbon domain-containing protein [Ferrimonas pelagia]|uniref:Zinc ribbon domain-containing protein n=1 Tax=Ferrimonas pelagia TaxID=1177826 RepID=A0ABP9F482_9GAMM
MSRHCPHCQQPLDWTGTHYHCAACQQDLRHLALCPDCQAELDKLQACGSASYFCHGRCNALKSKSRVLSRFEPIGPPSSD